jgi:hypothetical protein
VMMALVRALAAVLFRELDAVSLQSVHSADVNTVSPDHLHVFSNCGGIRHVPSPAFTMISTVCLPQGW